MLRTIFRQTKQRVDQDGNREDGEDVFRRLAEKRSANYTRNWHCDRWGEVYLRSLCHPVSSFDNHDPQLYQRQITTLKKIIESKTQSNAHDTLMWEFLHRTLTRYGVDGTSSDESEVENEKMELVFRIHALPWRSKNVNNLVRIVDKETVNLCRVMPSQGGRTLRRVWLQQNIEASSRKVPSNLSQSFYDNDWFRGIGEIEQELIEASEEQWEWVTFGINTSSWYCEVWELGM